MEYRNITSTSGVAGDGSSKIYAFVNGGSDGWWRVIAVRDDGTALAGHVCSHPSFGPGDIGCLANDWSGKRSAYEAACPFGYTLEWVDDIKSHPELSKIIADANAKHADAMLSARGGAA